MISRIRSPFYIFFLNPVYVAARSLRSLRSNYMALSHKDWELPNSWIWLAEMDIDGGLDFPI